MGRLTNAHRRLFVLPVQGEPPMDGECTICGRSLAGQRLGRWSGGLCDGCRSKRDRAKRLNAAWGEDDERGDRIVDGVLGIDF